MFFLNELVSSKISFQPNKLSSFVILVDISLIENVIKIHILTILEINIL